MGSGGTLQNETVSPGVVDQADYDAWRANFGATSGNGAASVAIPEPAAAVVLLLGIAGMWTLRGRRHW
jgi:hypothetical protein